MKYPEKILTTTKFVYWICDNVEDIELNNITLLDLICRYVKLMTTSLSPEQFVPCKDGKVLEEPDIGEDTTKEMQEAWEDYDDACDKILFDVKIKRFSNDDGKIKYGYIGIDFDIDNRIASELAIGEWKLHYKTIEDLITKIDIKGTETYWNLIFK